MTSKDTEVIKLEESIWYCSNDNKRYKGPFNFDGLIKFLSTKSNRNMYIFSMTSGKTYSFEELSKLYADQFNVSLSSYLSNKTFQRTGDLITGISKRSKIKFEDTAGSKLVMKDSLLSNKKVSDDNDVENFKERDDIPIRTSDEILYGESSSFGEYMVWLLLIMIIIFALMIFGIIEPVEIYKKMRHFLYPYFK